MFIMALLYVKQKGDFKHAETFLNRVLRRDYMSVLKHYGSVGVNALKEATPKDTGLTSESWYYEIVEGRGTVSLYFKNSNIVDGVPIAIVIQYGHATRNGGYVQGRDYINPVLVPLFNELAEKLWKEVTKK